MGNGRPQLLEEPVEQLLDAGVVGRDLHQGAHQRHVRPVGLHRPVELRLELAEGDVGPELPRPQRGAPDLLEGRHRQGEQEVVLVLEVAVERRARQAGVLQDLLHLQVHVPAGRLEQLLHHGQDPLDQLPLAGVVPPGVDLLGRQHATSISNSTYVL